MQPPVTGIIAMHMFMNKASQPPSLPWGWTALLLEKRNNPALKRPALPCRSVSIRPYPLLCFKQSPSADPLLALRHAQ